MSLRELGRFFSPGARGQHSGSQAANALMKTGGGNHKRSGSLKNLMVVLAL